MLQSIRSPFAGLLFAWRALAAVFDSDGGAAPQSTLTSITEVVVATVTSTVVLGPPPTSCDGRYCDTDGTMYCIYWAGFSSFDVSQHRPVPGETRTGYALCGTATATTTSAVTAPTAAYTRGDK